LEGQYPARRPHGAVAPAFFVAAAGLAWGHFEAGWVRLGSLACPLPRLPPELDGVRVAHLSDFHLGMPSRGRRAVERAVAWVEERQPDLTLISGDLLSRRSGERRLRELVGRLPRCFAVLGNHDFGRSRDPFADAEAVTDLGAATLLLDEARTVDIRGRSVQIVGVDPRSYRRGRSRPAGLTDPAADLRILHCHFPNVVDRIPAGSFDLVVAGHFHAGQITLPIPSRRIPLAHPRWRYFHGLYETDAGVMHVSAGLGTTFVPFRFLARPEATELVLESTAGGGPREHLERRPRSVRG
jgi:predicted MPP superfamily phosphohydrolase